MSLCRFHIRKTHRCVQRNKQKYLVKKFWKGQKGKGKEKKVSKPGQNAALLERLEPLVPALDHFPELLAVSGQASEVEKHRVFLALDVCAEDPRVGLPEQAAGADLVAECRPGFFCVSRCFDQWVGRLLLLMISFGFVAVVSSSSSSTSVTVCCGVVAIRGSRTRP